MTLTARSPFSSVRLGGADQGLMGKKVGHVACGGFHSAAILESGELYTWGGGEHGQVRVRYYSPPTALSPGFIDQFGPPNDLLPRFQTNSRVTLDGNGQCTCVRPCRCVLVGAEVTGGARHVRSNGEGPGLLSWGLR